MRSKGKFCRQHHRLQQQVSHFASSLKRDKSRPVRITAALSQPGLNQLQTTRKLAQIVMLHAKNKSAFCGTQCNIQIRKCSKASELPASL
jgi:hypothetical protein